MGWVEFGWGGMRQIGIWWSGGECVLVGCGEMGMSQAILGQLDSGGWDGVLGDVRFIGN